MYWEAGGVLLMPLLSELGVFQTLPMPQESWCESWRFECRHCGKMAFDLADRILDVMTGKTKVSWHTVCGTVREPLVHSGLTPEKLRTVSPVVSPTAAGLLTPTGDGSGRNSVDIVSTVSFVTPPTSPEVSAPFPTFHFLYFRSPRLCLH